MNGQSKHPGEAADYTRYDVAYVVSEHDIAQEIA